MPEFKSARDESYAGIPGVVARRVSIGNEGVNADALNVGTSIGSKLKLVDEPPQADTHIATLAYRKTGFIDLILSFRKSRYVRFDQ